MSESALSDEFLALISPCQSRLFGYLYSMLHNLDDTEDVLQQAVLAMWRSFDKYDRGRSFLPWAMQFAKLTALNHVRAKRRGRIVFNEELVLLMAESGAAAGDDADSLAGYQDSLLRCMDRLSSGDRGLIQLCYFERCSVTAVAERLGRARRASAIRCGASAGCCSTASKNRPAGRTTHEILLRTRTHPLFGRRLLHRQHRRG